MALNFLHLQWIHESIGILRQRFGKVRVLSLGYPELVVNRDEMFSLIGKETDSLRIRPDSEAHIKMANLAQLTDRIYEAMDFFQLMDCSFSTIDIVAHRGCERLVNLNYPVPEDMRDHFHLILDPGTLEHCFNAATALQNMVDMTMVGGRVLNHNPATHINHGFHNFSPTFYTDFYPCNGFGFLKYPLLTSGHYQPYAVHEGPLGAEYNNLLVERLWKHPVRWPSQMEGREHTYTNALYLEMRRHPEWRRVGVLPAGKYAGMLLDEELGPDLERLVLLDNHKTPGMYRGVPLEPTSRIGELGLDAVFIMSLCYSDDLVQQIGELGFPKAKTHTFETIGFSPLS